MRYYKSTTPLKADLAFNFLIEGNGSIRTKQMTKLLITKTVLRTILYQVILVFIGISVGFIINAKYWGNRSAVIERSMKNIFSPIKYDDRVRQALIQIGRERLYIEALHLYNDPIEIIEDSEHIKAEEWYECMYKYLVEDGTFKSKEYRTRIRWKPWEYYYDVEEEYWNPTLRIPTDENMDK